MSTHAEPTGPTGPTETTEPPSALLARAVVTALLLHGVRDVVVAPGSRNAPLSFAVHDAATAGLLRLHTRVDERSAAFLALGLTRAGARAAVVCTSGTAVANLHPAVLEAAHAGQPLVVVTADRPARLRGTDANQTTDQVGIFGALVATHDLAGPDDVPVLDDPWGRQRGVTDHDDALPPAARRRPGVVPGERPARVRPAGVDRIPLGPRTVVVAGDDAGPPARQLAERAGWPLLAEPSSGSRTGTHALRCYRLLLDTDLARSVERVVVVGHPTLSRPVMRLLGRDDVEVWATPGRGAWPARPYRVDRPLGGGRFELVDPADDPADDPAADPTAEVAAGPVRTPWLEAWLEADRAVARRLDALVAAEPGLTAYAVAGAVVRATPPGGLLVVGPSNPVRDLDLMQTGFGVGARRFVVANRGLAGIDGMVSTAIGAALGRPHSTRAIALLGDVTFLHDSNGLVLGPDEPRPDLTLVVVNDDGGSIFATLEQGAPEHADRFERLFGTPHGVDLAALCAATRTPHWRVESLPELEQALASPAGGIEVVEVRVPRQDRREVDARIRGLAAD
ncbi:2-succinyl-5-enolpyruvyl-6-hydroxy-3-cyclohexene- 1-carboxylic-acid synthase [Nocardioides kribbensis]|uniref:2-succinyl-5-enolpyruvyl-6-hydroxy-3- cyclohexene-1-carboxylate synthase n=1 Tax=Nocardioides kribbensis TaxID=305517 RepID=UPI0031D6EEAE